MEIWWRRKLIALMPCFNHISRCSPDVELLVPTPKIWADFWLMNIQESRLLSGLPGGCLQKGMSQSKYFHTFCGEPACSYRENKKGKCKVISRKNNSDLIIDIFFLLTLHLDKRAITLAEKILLYKQIIKKLPYTNWNWETLEALGFFYPSLDTFS